MSNVAQVVDSCHELLLWMLPQLDNFPRNRRFTLGERLEGTLLQVLELLVQAAYSRDKREPLTRANSRLAVARHLWHLSHELEVVSTRRYQHGAERIDAIGACVHAWIGRAVHADTCGLRARIFSEIFFRRGSGRGAEPGVPGWLVEQHAEQAVYRQP